MFKYWISASKDGKFLFKTEADGRARCFDAAELISKSCPELKLMIYSQSNSLNCIEYLPSKFMTKLRNIHLADRSDGLEDVYDKLLDYQEAGLDVLVIREGAIGYFDIQLPDLTYVSALSAYHLVKTPDEE